MVPPNCRRAAWIVPSVDAGGIGPVAFEVSSALAAMGGCDVTLIETHASPQRDYTEKSGLRRVSLDMGATREPPHVVLDWLETNPQDIVFSNGVSHLEEIFPAMTAITLHVAVLHDAGRQYRAEVLSCAPYLDGVVTVSDYVHGWVQPELRVIGFPGIIRRIYNGTSYPHALKRTRSAGPLRLLFIGSVAQKGTAELPSLVKALKRRGVDFRLTVISKDDFLRRGFADSELRDRVITLPLRPRADLWNTYAAHDLFLMLGFGEAFGMVTIEAMGMGCVPIAYDMPAATGEIIEPGLSGLLVSPNSNALAAAIAGMSHARLTLMSSEAARRARTLFNAERAAQEYLRLIEDLVRCGELIKQTRLSGIGPRFTSKASLRSPLVLLYHVLPSGFRRYIRRSLWMHPTSARWIRERF